MKAEFIKPSNEEIKRIKNKDNEVTKKYYLLNYNLIVTVCRSFYFKNKQRLFSYEDMVNEIYLYFYRLSFDNNFVFVRSIHNICVYVAFGGERSFHQVEQGNCDIVASLDQEVSFERSHGGENLQLKDVIEDNFDIVETLYPEDSFTDKVFEIIIKFLSPRQAEAMSYFYYTDITARDVGEKMGININGAQSLKTSAMTKLKKNKNKILEALLEIGYEKAFDCFTSF